MSTLDIVGVIAFLVVLWLFCRWFLHASREKPKPKQPDAKDAKNADVAKPAGPAKPAAGKPAAAKPAVAKQAAAAKDTAGSGQPATAKQ